MELAELAWPEVVAGTVVAVPVGSTEQHGPHLPLGTDTVVATTLARRLAAARSGVAVAPAVAIGASGEHAGFPGTLSIGTEVLRHVLVEIGRSADDFGGIVFVNGHGGNHEALLAAVELLVAEGRRALAWWPAVAGGDAHAGRVETSLLLAIDPGVVRLDLARPGTTEPLADLLPELRLRGLRAVAPNGVLGDPSGASADEGGRLLDALSADLVAAVDGWRR